MLPPRSHSLKSVHKPRVFDKPRDYALAFQTGKGHNDALLQRFILGRHLREENALFCIFDGFKSVINYRDFGADWPSARRKPTPPDAQLYWQHLEDPEWRKPKVGSYWFWGLMRNTKRIVEVAGQKDIDWFFIDHAYLYHQRHSAFEKYGDLHNCLYRVCKNNYVINKITDTNDQKLLDLKSKFQKDDELDIEKWKKKGKHIVVFPPSWWLCKNLGMRAEQVLQQTIDELKKHTDREIKVRVKKIDGKYNTIPLHEDLKDAHAVVSYQSSAAAKAIIKGVPSFCITDKYSAALPMSLTDLSKIEEPIYPANRFEWLCNLANHQFYASEIQSGQAKRYLDEQDT